ncbi:hypothetical protein Celaphus_00015389 [Cervus elaphus hippelaphus]|uniref:Cyclin-dependent kinase 20 n=1 Tax=Cervus elaphus hippelaphus TaxID=46360 RepID=A0A212CS52_CEREH|nr:hypothetical protein Celaphus_00015389 [Cervus elaphus hippelaphus]
MQQVALRRLEDRIPNQVLRKIRALQEIEDSQLGSWRPCSHVAQASCWPSSSCCQIWLVVRHTQRPLPQAQVKSYLQMLPKGVAFCHANNVVHRDLKPANLLISASGLLKVADFGLARVFSPDDNRLHTHQVATRWYRAPELLYGTRQYDQGENDIEQLCCVLGILGTPSRQGWPQITELPDYKIFKEHPPAPLEEVLPYASPQALDLLGRFLLCPPQQRISASQALLHHCFFTAALPVHPSELPIPQGPGGPAPKAHPGPPHVHDFHVDRPLEDADWKLLDSAIGSAYEEEPEIIYRNSAFIIPHDPDGCALLSRLVYAQQGTEVPPKHHQHGLSRGIVEEASESFKNTEIDMTSEQAKDIQARLFLSHLECNVFKLDENSHALYLDQAPGQKAALSKANNQKAIHTPEQLMQNHRQNLTPNKSSEIAEISINCLTDSGPAEVNTQSYLATVNLKTATFLRNGSKGRRQIQMGIKSLMVPDYALEEFKEMALIEKALNVDRLAEELTEAAHLSNPQTSQNP